MHKILFVVSFVMCIAHSAGAQSLNGEQELQAKNLFTELRCVVCQNQSIADSDADVAKDLRKIVREKIAQGNSSSQIKEFLVLRYGEFVLLKPSFAMHTVLLWLSPFIFLALGFVWLAKSRTEKIDTSKELSASEKVRVEELLLK